MEGIKFVNDLCCNYLTIPYEGSEQDFALRMMTENVTDMFVPVELRRMDGQILLYYNISGMQNMDAVYTERQIDRSGFQAFLWQLHEAAEQSGELFLPGDGICLEPSVIFWDLGLKRWKLIYIPGKEKKEPAEMQREKEMLAEFFVVHMDYEDNELTETVYRFYEEVCAGGDFFRMEMPGENLPCGETPLTDTSFSEEVFVQEEETEGWWDEERESEETAGERKEKGKGPGGHGGGRWLIIGWIFLGLAAAATLSVGRILPDMVLPGGAVCALLAVILLIAGIKRKNRQESPEEIVEENLEKGIDTERGEVGYWEAGGSGEQETETDAAEEKTVYMDIQSENEKKLYGVGKFRRQKILLDKLPCLVGKDSTLVNHIVSDASVSRMHAKFFEEKEAVWMQDLNSTNGTYHNGMRLSPNEKVCLEPEDEVGFGQAQFIFR